MVKGLEYGIRRYRWKSEESASISIQGLETLRASTQRLHGVINVVEGYLPGGLESRVLSPESSQESCYQGMA